MKWLFIPATALSVALATPAFASPAPTTSAATASVQLAQRDRDQQRRPGAQTPPPQQGQGTQQRQQTRQPPPAPQRRQMQPRRVAPKPTPLPKQQPRFDWKQYQQKQFPPALKRHRTFDIHPWQRNFRAEKRYHWQPYHRPPGWYFQRWIFGMVLPTLFWSRDYWVENYWEFGLPDPPYGYVWVRNGDDALLVNVRTGYILQVVYDLFE